MAKTQHGTVDLRIHGPVTEGPTPLITLAEFITLVHLIKREVHQPRPSLVDNYNSIVEIRDLIDEFEKVH